MTTPKEQRTEPGEIHPKFWERTVRDAFRNDPIRIIIELIKNSADSYTRLYKKGEIKPPFEIFVKILCEKRSPPSIEVLDYAEGMSSEKLREALKYGTQTSMGEDIEAVTSAEKGIGLKDAMMALEDNWLITIKDGLINERKIHSDFKIGIGKEDEEVTNKERDELGIPKNGTLVIGDLPSYFQERKFSTICERLQQHFLLRKLLQNPDYKIYVVDGWTKEKKLLSYKPPEVEKQILKESFKINYNGKDYFIHLEVNKSKNELTQGKPYGEAGILFFYGNYSVLDFTFGRFDKDLSFSKFFGEARMEIEKIIRDPEEDALVDEKRRGLKLDHPFNQKLLLEVEKRLKTIQEEEEASKYSFDEHTKREILKELNKIYKDIKGRGPPPEPPIKPDNFEFHPPYTEIMEFEPKKIFLIINSSIVSDELEISLKSTNLDIVIKGNNIIKIEKEKIKEEFLIKQIEVYSEKPGIRGEIIASTKKPNHTAKIGIKVLENPIFSPKDGFAFVPEKTTIVDGGEKKVQLCIDKNFIRSSKEIILSSQDPINCPGKWLLPNPKNMQKCIIKNIVLIEIPIKVKGNGHVGEKATVTANYEDKTTDLHITIVPEPSITGLFRDIRPSPKETKRISGFIEEEGVLEIYYKHPLIKKYMTRKNFRNRGEFLVFIADTITREVIKAFVLSGIEENSSRFPIFDSDHPEPEIEGHITREYYEQGPKMHDMFINLAKNLKLEE
jgi:hypothetical protein